MGNLYVGMNLEATHQGKKEEGKGTFHFFAVSGACRESGDSTPASADGQ